MNQQDLPTDRSIEIEDIPAHGMPSRHSQLTNCSLFAKKMVSHLEFMETEFIRNLQWQKKLLNQLLTQQSSYSERFKSSYLKAESGNNLKLNVNQQHALREILGMVLGQQHGDLSIKQLIKEAAAKQKHRRSTSQVYTFSPNKEEDSSPIQFPAFKRVITLNDLAPSTQKELTASPPSLPPRTPKQKNPKNKQIIKEQEPFLSPILYGREFQSSEKSMKGRFEFKEYEGKRGREISGMQDSLGKRLFQDDKDRLIYIKDNPEEQNLPGSQVSLTLSQSNNDRKKFANKEVYSINFNESSIPTDRSLQTLYLKVLDQGDPAKRKNASQIQNASQIAGLCFAGNPKRRIGKYVIKKQNYFAYNQNCSHKVKKMHDTFGMAYQEYYCETTSFGQREDDIYHRKRALMQKRYNDQN